MGIEYPALASACRAGHFVMVTVADGVHPILPRPFSIFRLLGDDGEPLNQQREAASVRGVEILYKDVGLGTGLLSRKTEGETVGVLGPCGLGLFPPTHPADAVPEAAILVAGGVGIAPIYFAAVQLAARDVPCLLYYGGRGRENLYAIDDLHPIQEIIATTEDGSAGERGRVTSALADNLRSYSRQGFLGRDLSHCELLACGPEAMLRSVVKVVSPYGLPMRLSLERRMGCAMGACRGCVVEVAGDSPQPIYERVCHEGPVFPSQRVVL